MFLLALVFGAALINQGATQTCKYKEETDKSRPESSSYYIPNLFKFALDAWNYRKNIQNNQRDYRSFHPSTQTMFQD